MSRHIEKKVRKKINGRATLKNICVCEYVEVFQQLRALGRLAEDLAGFNS